MATGRRKTTVESRTLSIALKRAMDIRGINSKDLAKKAEIPYSTMRKILDINSVADYEQLRRIAQALRMPLSRIILDAEALADDPEIIADYQEETDTSASAVSDAEAVLATADNGIDIDTLANEFRADDEIRAACERADTEKDADPERA